MEFSSPLPPPQVMSVNLEFALPLDLANLRDGAVLEAPLTFAAPLALGLVLIAKAFGATALPPSERWWSGGRRYRRSAAAASDRAGPDLTDILGRLNIRSPACQALVVCETHRLIGRLPTPLLRHYSRLSGRLRGVHLFSGAATRGLDGDLCQDGGRCGRTPLQLLLDTGLLRRRRTAA